MKRILILVDYREQFWLTTRHKQASFIVSDLQKNFEAMGYAVKVCKFSDMDFRAEDYRGWFVVYQSTEDPYLLYNSFIEDILLALQEQGAILLPGFKYNRAHHNKVFMELLRSLSKVEVIKKIRSFTFGTYEEYAAFCHSDKAFFPQIVKLAEGAQSKNVCKVSNLNDSRRIKGMMWFSDFRFWLKDKIKGFWPSRYPNFRPQSSARRKIVVQNFIDGLSCDYKVLVFGGKFYILQRGVRPGDFRASGSGLFEFPAEVSAEFLDFARLVYDAFDVPFISMDIARRGDDFYLIEFQFLAFGTYTLEKANWHFEYNGSVWQKVSSQDNLEFEFCAAIDKYIRNHA